MPHHARAGRALISVSDKTGITEFAAGLVALDYEVISTGGTAQALKRAGIPVTSVSEITRTAEMLQGRVKTLHPAVHGAILADRAKPEHMRAIAELGIEPIDIVCVNLYPFEATIADRSVEPACAIENIDIGGPAMIRSAAKNHESVAVVVRPDDYELVLEELRQHGGKVTAQTRSQLAALAFAHTAVYDAAIAGWFSDLTARRDPGCAAPFPPELALGLRKVQDCRYGENPHQHAAFYRIPGACEPCIGTARQLHGKELSFNNIFDLNAALETVKEFADEGVPAVVVVKHANPCGVALAEALADAFRRARDADPVSAFGGILALNRPLDIETAEEITGKNTFFEAIIAPGYQEGVVPMLTERKKWGANLRVMETADLRDWRRAEAQSGLDFKRVVGGVLAQTPDHIVIGPTDLRTVTRRAPTALEVTEMLFAWRVVRHVKSNAIVFTKDRQTVGIGAGQMNRVQSVRLAVEHAGAAARGAVMASDAFFPFPDGPEAAASAGVSAIIQPGGSVKDQDTIELADRHGIAMVFTGVRHFLH